MKSPSKIIMIWNYEIMRVGTALKILATIILMATLALVAVSLAGCASPIGQPPVGVGTTKGISRVQTASEAARWSNNKVIKQSVGDTKVYAEATDHSLNQIDEGAGQAEADTAVTAKSFTTVVTQRDAAQAKATGYDNSWTGGKPRRLWARLKLWFWIAVGVLAADWIALTFFSTSPIGKIAGIGWSAVKGAGLLVWGWFRKTPAAPSNNFM